MDKFTKVYINIAPKVSFEKEEFVVYMDNFNIFGPKANALITYEIRFTIWKFTKIDPYSSGLAAVMQRGSNVIMGMVLLATVFCNPIGLDRYYTTLFEFLILFLLPVRLDQSTQAMVEALLKPILSFDFMRSLQEPAPRNLPTQFQNIGVSHSFLINGLFPLLFIGIGYLFMLFSRLQTEGQHIEANKASRNKLFFIQARKFMDMSGVLIFCRAYFGQLFFCSLLFIAYYNPSYTTADMIIPSFTFLFSLSIVVKFYNTFTYDIRDQQPKKSDIEGLNLERRLRHEYGFAATFVPVELSHKSDNKPKTDVDLEDPDERKAFYESLDFFSEYKRQQEARANAVVSDYEVESLKYDKRYRPILLEIKMEKFLNRLYRLADLVSALLQIFLICCLQSSVIYQLISLIGFEALMISYLIKTRPYISKLQNCWLIGNRFMRLSVMIILTIFAIDDAKWMFSKYTRFRVLDCKLLQSILVYHFFLNSIYMLYGIGMKLPHLWRFFFNKRYYEMMLKMLNPHAEANPTPESNPAPGAKKETPKKLRSDDDSSADLAGRQSPDHSPPSKNRVLLVKRKLSVVKPVLSKKKA